MSVESISMGQIPNKNVSDSSVDLDKIQPKSVSDLDGINFENEMSQPDPAKPLMVNSIDKQQMQAALDKEMEINQSPGDNILQTVQGVRDQYMQIEDNLRALTSKGSDLSSVDLMQLQFEVMQLSYMNELSSKAVDKTNNMAQTLMRNQ